jgi:hypothetical protein
MIDGGLVVDTVAVEPVSASNPQTEYFPSIKKGVGGTIRNPNSLLYLDSTKTREAVVDTGGQLDSGVVDDSPWIFVRSGTRRTDSGRAGWP